MRTCVAAYGDLPHHRRMTAPTFKDHFSRQSADYSRYRPGYPRRTHRVGGRASAGSHAGGRLRHGQRPGGRRTGGTLRHGARRRRQRRAARACAAASARALRAGDGRAPARARCIRVARRRGAGRALVRLRAVPCGMPSRPEAGRCRGRLDLREVPRQPSRRRGHGPVLRARHRAVLAARAALRRRGLRDAPVPLGRGARAVFPAADRMVAGAGHRLPRELVFGAALSRRAPRPGPAAGRRGRAGNALACRLARFVSTGRSTSGWVETDSLYTCRPCGPLRPRPEPVTES